MNLLWAGLCLELFSGFLGVVLFISLFMRYLGIPNIATLWLSLFALMHGANNFIWFYSDLPEIENISLASAGYATYGLIPMFAMLFAAELTSRKRLWYALALAVASLFLVLNGIFPPQKVFIEGIGFWIPSGESFYPYIASTAMSFVPSVLFLVFWRKTRERKGLYLSMGFALMALFESLFEANMLLPLYITNFFEAAGLLMIFAVYTRGQKT